jgi:hypothetical protein
MDGENKEREVRCNVRICINSFSGHSDGTWEWKKIETVKALDDADLERVLFHYNVLCNLCLSMIVYFDFIPTSYHD